MKIVCSWINNAYPVYVCVCARARASLSFPFFSFHFFFLGSVFSHFHFLSRWVFNNFELIEMGLLKIVHVHDYYTPRLLHDCFLIHFSLFTIQHSTFVIHSIFSISLSLVSFLQLLLLRLFFSPSVSWWDVKEWKFAQLHNHKGLASFIAYV